MSLRRINSRAKVAISKAQQSTGIVVPDLTNRVTALEQEDQAINTDINDLYDITNTLAAADSSLDTRIDALEAAALTGYSGSITLIDTVNFSTSSVTTKTLTYLNGKLTEVI